VFAYAEEYTPAHMATVRHTHESELLTPSEVAVELRVTAGTVKRWLRSGTLPGVRLPSGEWRIAETDLRELRTRTVSDHSRRGGPITNREMM
jgi:excisionase family DNA binding protein